MLNTTRNSFTTIASGSIPMVADLNCQTENRINWTDGSEHTEAAMQGL
jgi:hypothetical protein